MGQEEVLDTLQKLVDDVDYIRRSTDDIVAMLDDIKKHLSYMASEKR